MGFKSSWRFIWELWKIWGALVSGAFSVPFAAAAVFSSSQYGPLIWGVLAYGALVMAAFLLWRRVVGLENKLKPKLKVTHDPIIPSCDAVVGFRDGTKSRCIRLQVENIGLARLNKCEGWLESIPEMTRLSPAKLFWVGIPEEGSVDLTKNIPRFLQVFRIHETNRIVPGTFGNPPEQFPVDLLNRFVVGETYHFRIGLKGDDEAETLFGTVKLIWTGDWATAQVSYAAEN